ncbi:MAG: glycosyl hydrolase family 18 protein [Ignavibacteria bacterium]|nr:glycosyl hydrolase family 18 protein [Ignavibacteria bacterium]
MRFLLIIFAFLILQVKCLSQPHSIHKADKETYGHLSEIKSLKAETVQEIIPLRFEKSELTESVFGYLPYWEYPTAKNYLRYDLLTHIALFDFAADSLGNVFNPPYWPWTDVINKAHENGVKVILSTTNFEASQMRQLLNSDSAKQNLFLNLKNKVEAYKLDGVNIDFEEYYSADRGDLLNNFMKQLTDSLHAAIPNCEVSFAGPAVNWSGWKLAGLANACDYIFIMGYAFAGSWSDYTGSNAPLLGGTYNITNTITKQYADVIKTNPKKLILGVPYYGNKWTTRSSTPHDSTISYGKTTRFRDDVTASQTYGLLWENTEKTPWYRWKLNDTTWYQVWFDNDTSLGMKYDLAKANNLKGIGMWALGYDGSRTELWDAIEKHVVEVDAAESEIVADKFILSQNYPNPFNPETIISWQSAVGSYVTLKVFDVLGNEIATLVNEEKPEGVFKVEFNVKTVRHGRNAPSLSSGLYFYQLRAGEFTQTKKMLYLK